MAEYTVALMFVVAKQIVQADKALKEHRWGMRIDYSGIELAGKTLGIVGLGEIGAEVARLSKPLGTRVLYWSRTRKEDKEKKLGMEYVQLTEEDKKNGLRVPEKLLKESDFISVHSALTEQTRGLIGRKEIAAMKNGAYFINTARGELVNEQELYDALRNGKLAAAGLDVFEKEPPYDSPLLTLQNVVVGPHVAALAKDAMRRVSVWCAEDVVNVLNHKPPMHPVNPQVLEKTRKQ